MLRGVKENIDKISGLIEEYKIYRLHHEQILKKIRRLDRELKTRQIKIEDYEEILLKETGKRTKEEALKYYEDYLNYLKRQILRANAEIFYWFYKEQPNIAIAKQSKISNIKHFFKNLIKINHIETQPTKIEEKHKHESKHILHKNELRKKSREEFKESKEKEKQILANKKEAETQKVQLAQKEAEKNIAPIEKKSSETNETALWDKIRSLDFKKVFLVKGKSERIEKEAVKAKKLLDKELEKEKVKKAEEAKKEIKPEKESKEPELLKAEKLLKEKEAAQKPLVELKKKTFSDKLKSFFGIKKKPKSSLLDKIIQEEPEKTTLGKNEPKVEIESITKSLARFFRIKPKKRKLFSEKTELTPTLMGLRGEEVIIGVREGAQGSLMLEEARHVRELLRKRKEYEIYKPSSIGALANITVKKISFFLLDQFPDFFRKFHTSLRMANVPVLSNTYVNIMVFCSMLAFFISFLFYTLINITIGGAIAKILPSALFTGILTATAVFLIFYYYPENKIKSRRRSINANLPFAIDHMAAVVSSGIPPLVMFRLIAESEEYEEISVELNKIVLYADVFGYDLISAIRAVSETTPSPTLKEFFEGMVLSIETGGDLSHYLTQKSQESMLSYRLERQKYVEALATYSDIYTGILIAAPLFFISTLSLMSLLGGTVGNIGVESLMIYGTYLVIPALNVAFIIYLQMSQPEI
ncbi:MAG: type II secretion system F family protein [Nanoarchaeota archaeon]|nr:type II secretion system F family protein [Nanoarchaeota archaeon]